MYGRTPWKSDELVARPLPTRDITAQRDKNKHPSSKRDSNPRFSVRALKDTPQNERPLDRHTRIIGTFIFSRE
jgi:hypothetical protein